MADSTDRRERGLNLRGTHETFPSSSPLQFPSSEEVIQDLEGQMKTLKTKLTEVTRERDLLKETSSE